MNHNLADILAPFKVCPNLRAYHGTENTFREFSLDKCGSASGVRSDYLYFTSSRENAAFYGPLILTVELSLHNPLVFAGDTAKRMPVRELANEAILSNFHNETEYDGVIVRDVIDGTHYSDIFVVFEPEQIRIIETEDTCPAYCEQF